MSLGVVYLWRAQNHPKWLRFFLKSLIRHPAGANYDLIVIRKGFASDEPPRLPADFAAPGLDAIRYVDVSDEIFATDAFFEAARAVEHERLLYFVSWARVLAPGWAAAMLAAEAATPDCGVVGATSGWEALDETTPFPNPSIRTTGFLIRRKLFLAVDPGAGKVIRDGNRYEAGPDSMTRRIERKGLVAVVTGRDGQVYRTDDWPKARTFRAGDQENLLFADNRTHAYAAAGAKKRQRLAAMNWGDAAEIATPPVWRRLWRKLAWRMGW